MLKVLFACGREPSYVRNAMILQSLHRNFECQAVHDSRPGSLSFRVARVALRLLPHLYRPHDLIFIGFYGYPLVLLTRRLSKAKLIFDPFVSNYDTLILDRNHFSQSSLPAFIFSKLDRESLLQADRILSDTKAHARYYSETFQIPFEKFRNLYLGSDETLFCPQMNLLPPKTFTVFTYSSYMPLHGVDIIVDAAYRCQSLPIRFRIIGDQGPTYNSVQAKAKQCRLTNIDFVPYTPYKELPNEIGQASLCLGGHFGSSVKASRVIAGKTYQFVAMKKPVILGDNLANKELFQHKQNAYLVKQNDPEELAQAISTLYADPALCQSLANHAYKLFDEQLSWAKLETTLVETIKSCF